MQILSFGNRTIKRGNRNVVGGFILYALAHAGCGQTRMRGQAQHARERTRTKKKKIPARGIGEEKKQAYKIKNGARHGRGGKASAQKKIERKRRAEREEEGVEASGCCYCCPDDVSNVIATSSPFELGGLLQGA